MPYSPIETTLGALATCAAEAARKVFRECGEVVKLQPVMRLEIAVTSDDVGGVLTDLTSIRQVGA
jgi:translation elongation factor EF-G